MFTQLFTINSGEVTFAVQSLPTQRAEIARIAEALTVSQTGIR